MVPSPSPVVKLGAWGSDAGAAHDIDAAATAPHRLESIAARWGKVIDSVAFTYTDEGGQLHTAGPWGGTAGEKEDTITLGPMEYVTQVAWLVGPFQFKEIEDCVTSLKFVTNQGATYGPFGRGDGAHHSLPVLDGGSLVGMFCRAEDYLHAIGFYVRPLAVVESTASPAKPQGEGLPALATEG
ncbi:horcolin-like [Triticum urartu]|uniref:Jacalin-type lectin domain-containing protein n=1 Tax=Triticum urartu TaxID=4572 RepID=A0A8R7PYV6_TRIUA|nr:horcolin-like [Triticum urartu]